MAFKIPKASMSKMSKMPAAGIKRKAPVHTIARPRLHRQGLAGQGKSAFGTPGSKTAFSDPEAGTPAMAFPPGGGGMPGGGGGDPGAGATPPMGGDQGGPPEPGEADGGPPGAPPG
jgi:translation initiation factor IF-2